MFVCIQMTYTYICIYVNDIHTYICRYVHMFTYTFMCV